MLDTLALTHSVRVDTPDLAPTEPSEQGLPTAPGPIVSPVAPVGPAGRRGESDPTQNPKQQTPPPASRGGRGGNSPR